MLGLCIYQGASGFLHRGVCASSATSAAAYWRNSVPPADQSQPSESAAGTCPPTAELLPPPSGVGPASQRVEKTSRRRRKGSAPAERSAPSLFRVASDPLLSWRRGLGPGWSLTGWACGEMWNSLLREKSSGLSGCFWRLFGEFWSLRLCSE